MSNAVIMTPQDDVATVTQAISAGEQVAFSREGKTVTVTAVTDVPLYHKIALRDLSKGAPVLKYGECIGYAAAPIRAGEHVHTQNLSSTL